MVFRFGNGQSRDSTLRSIAYSGIMHVKTLAYTQLLIYVHFVCLDA